MGCHALLQGIFLTQGSNPRRLYLQVGSLPLDFPGGSDGKASVYNAGDLGSIPGSGRSAGERNGIHSSTIAWKIPWGRKESDTTERVHFPFLSLPLVPPGKPQKDGIPCQITLKYFRERILKTYLGFQEWPFCV